MTDADTTLRPAAGAHVRTELEVRRSRFLTILTRATSVEEARTLVTAAREEYPDARHHCAAWIVTEPGSQPLRHSSDDGEPSGTAGRPMLDVLDGAGVVDVAAVVVRYFGGVLLGTGGLVRAYSDAVAEALAETPLVRSVPLDVTEVALPHDLAPRVENDVRSGVVDARVLDVAYDGAGVTLRLATVDTPALHAHLASASSGTARPRPAGTVVVDVPRRRP